MVLFSILIMWELLTGRRPFGIKFMMQNLFLKYAMACVQYIVSNISDVPDGYIELMQEC